MPTAPQHARIPGKIGSGWPTDKTAQMTQRRRAMLPLTAGVGGLAVRGNSRTSAAYQTSPDNRPHSLRIAPAREYPKVKRRFT
jgi:hypothetical protein